MVEPVLYKKKLVAKFSPKNGCYVPEGATLTVIPRARVPLKEAVRHYFVSANDPKVKSLFGWVIDSNPFSLEEFVERELHESSLSELELEHLHTMLGSIVVLSPGTAVGATYFKRGVIEKKMVFAVHKVILFPVSGPGPEKGDTVN